ncbi:hypothetical protein FD724_38640 (plasmid) [Nostoc sp. C057]|uniref:hypothetical protein n=1 Tax=Nostoc sp. C057 TaxID=2576903 RepID=UPI0015C3D9A6|nr:hypothetical protein [Nostoc sp. C057]QLE53764.1 hypothetical protein FD724_38640 [Nostoc sp. C057]
MVSISNGMSVISCFDIKIDSIAVGAVGRATLTNYLRDLPEKNQQVPFCGTGIFYWIAVILFTSTC